MDKPDPRVRNPEAVLRDGSSELFDMCRQEILKPGGLFFFAKFFCQFIDLDERAHMPLCMFYEQVGRPTHLLRDGQVQLLAALVEYPKSHLKTTIGTIANILHKFACLAVSGKDLTERFALASNTKSNSQRFLRLMKHIPENGQVFQQFFPEMIPEFSNDDVWNQSEIIFPRSRQFTDPSVDTLGIGGASTSRHYTGIIEDDMLDEESHDSASAIRKAVAQHQYFTSLLVDDTCWYLVNEHSWNDYDLNKHVIDKEPTTAVFSVGASRGLHPGRSRHVPSNIMEMARVWEDGQAVWPKRYPPKSLQIRREKAGARLYNAVYENDPFDEDAVDFKEEWLRYYEFDAKGNVRILPHRGIEMEIVPLNSLYRVAAFDPALSEKESADESALEVVGVDAQERIFLLEDWGARMDPLKVLDVVFEKVMQWKVFRCGIETVLFQKVLHDLLQKHCRDWNAAQAAKKRKTRIWPGIFEEIKPPSRRQDKDARMRALIGTNFENGRVYVRKEQTAFIDEYLHFPISHLKDRLDAFAYTSLLWMPGEDAEETEAILEEEQRQMAMMDTVTGY